MDQVEKKYNFVCFKLFNVLYSHQNITNNYDPSGLESQSKGSMKFCYYASPLALRISNVQKFSLIPMILRSLRLYNIVNSRDISLRKSQITHFTRQITEPLLLDRYHWFWIFFLTSQTYRDTFDVFRPKSLLHPLIHHFLEDIINFFIFTPCITQSPILVGLHITCSSSPPLDGIWWLVFKLSSLDFFGSEMILMVFDDISVSSSFVSAISSLHISFSSFCSIMIFSIVSRQPGLSVWPAAGVTT